MQASIVDLRYHMSDVLSALGRNEVVEVLYRKKKLALLTPISKVQKNRKKMQDHAFVGMIAANKENVDSIIDQLRGDRYDDL